MADKVQKIREWVKARLDENTSKQSLPQFYGMMEEDARFLDFLNSLQKEPVKIKKGCKYRCLSDMVNRDTGNIAFIWDKIYFAPKDDTLVSEEYGYLCDISKDASNFELVEESVSEDLITAAKVYADNITDKVGYKLQLRRAVVYGAKWQKEQMMKDAIETTIADDWQYGKDKDHTTIPAIHQRINGCKVDEQVKIVILKDN